MGGVGELLRESKKVIAVEILILALVITLIHSPLVSTPLLVIMGWVSLRLRGVGWRGVGLSSPRRPVLTLLAGVALGVLLLFSDLYFVEPLLARWLGSTPDLAQLEQIKGNVLLLLSSVVLIAWLLAAFGEELAYRGYALNRLAELLGGGRAA